jgi:hypothetical protein
MIKVNAADSTFCVWEHPGGVSAGGTLAAGSDKTGTLLRQVELELTPHQPVTEAELALSGALYLEQLADSALALAKQLRIILDRSAP